MHIVIAGGHGLLGSALTRRLRQEGHAVSVLTRAPRHDADIGWDPAAGGGAWRARVGAADAVINLAGESIAGRRWTATRKRALLESRVRATRALVEAIRDAPQPPRTFLSGSGIGIYGPRGDEPVTEQTAPGSDFLARLCVAWEAEAMAAAPVTRVVLLRTGVVLARSGGALPQMALPFRLFAGGPLASGDQYVSWIHIDDWVEMTRWAMVHDDPDRAGRESPLAGPLNVTAPNPVTNREVGRTLGRVLRRPAFVPAPAFALRLVLGEMADAVVSGQRVVPARAMAAAFPFAYPELEPALRAIYHP